MGLLILAISSGSALVAILTQVSVALKLLKFVYCTFFEIHNYEKSADPGESA